MQQSRLITALTAAGALVAVVVMLFGDNLVGRLSGDKASQKGASFERASPSPTSTGSAPQPAVAQPRSLAIDPGVLAGVWEGQYEEDGIPGRTPFRLTARVQGTTFTGRISERVSGNAMLNSTIRGTFDGNILTFQKTYEGYGHSSYGLQVEFQGSYDVDTRTVRGQWQSVPFVDAFPVKLGHFSMTSAPR